MKGKCNFCRRVDVEVEETLVENKKGYICEACKKRYAVKWDQWKRGDKK